LTRVIFLSSFCSHCSYYRCNEKNCS